MDLEFRTQLIAFLRACGCPDTRVFNLLRGVLFKNLRVRFVGSVARMLKGKRMSDFGHMRLRAILQSLAEYYASLRVEGGECGGGIPECDDDIIDGGSNENDDGWEQNRKSEQDKDGEKSNDKPTQQEHPMPILSLCSSIGSPNKKWLQSILCSCHGGRALSPAVKLNDCLHVVFPTEKCVKESRIGEDMAGSLIFTRKNFEAGRYSRQYLKQYKNIEGREGTLPHAKYRERRRRE